MKSAIERKLEKSTLYLNCFLKSNKLHCSTNQWKFFFIYLNHFLSRPFFFLSKIVERKTFFFLNQILKEFKMCSIDSSQDITINLKRVLVCVYIYTARYMHSPASANIYIYMVLIVLLVVVCVRTSEQMAKLINGGSKISLSLSRSFILLFFVP